MALISVWGFHIQEGREQEFGAWLAANEQQLAASAPKNYEYLGTYLPVWGYEGGRSYRQMWRYGSGGPVDLRASNGSGPEFTRLAGELLAFVDEERSQDETFVLFRSVTEIE